MIYIVYAMCQFNIQNNMTKHYVGAIENIFVLRGMNCNQIVTTKPQSVLPSIRLGKCEINVRLGLCHSIFT